MNDHPAKIDRTGLKFWMTDLYRHRFSSPKPQVFLCGAQPQSIHHDMRKQLKSFLARRCNCKAFLGEDISEFFETKPVIKRDHLTIEVDWATRSDLIIMFLGSAGTIAELTAFSLNDSIRHKLLVFNDIHYIDTPSFIAQGPLRILNPRQVVHYEPNAGLGSAPVMRHIDLATARAWHTSSRLSKISVDFEYHLVFSLIIACFPATREELIDYTGFSQASISDILKKLYDSKYVENRNGYYYLVEDLHNTYMNSQEIADVMRLRATFLSIELDRESFIDRLRTVNHQITRGGG